MKKLEVTINGKSYPCMLTVGAMVRFKDLTGREVDEMSGMSDAVRLLWCCTASACNREHVEFPFSCTDFLDAVSDEDLQAFSEALMQGTGEKKSPR